MNRSVEVMRSSPEGPSQKNPANGNTRPTGGNTATNDRHGPLFAATRAGPPAAQNAVHQVVGQAGAVSTVSILEATPFIYEQHGEPAPRQRRAKLGPTTISTRVAEETTSATPAVHIASTTGPALETAAVGVGGGFAGEDYLNEAQQALLRSWRLALDGTGTAPAEPWRSAFSALWDDGSDPLAHPAVVSVRAKRRDQPEQSSSSSEQKNNNKGDDGREKQPAEREKTEQESASNPNPKETSHRRRGGTPRGVTLRGAALRKSEAEAPPPAMPLAPVPEEKRGTCFNWLRQTPCGEFLDYNLYLAPSRPINKCRETRAIEKEDRRRAVEHEDWRRRRHAQFLRSLLARREEVLKQGRARRNDAAKCARMCKSHFELLSHRAEVEDAKAGRRRLAALRANDMEAYTKLVEETKNERLKYLLHETDKYIVSITDKVKAQRQDEEFDEALKKGRSVGAAVSGLVTGTDQESQDLDERADDDHDEVRRKNTEGVQNGDDDEELRRRATSEYYKITHQRVEEVKQPSLLINGQLKEYQLAGLSWLVSLYNNRLNGILADEMGLGKTIQSIALIAHLMEHKQNYGPFLVIAPLSTLGNWANEFAKWTPSIHCLSYKGPPAARKEVQKEIHSYLAWLKHQRAVDGHRFDDDDDDPFSSSVGRYDDDDDDDDDFSIGGAEQDDDLEDDAPLKKRRKRANAPTRTESQRGGATKKKGQRRGSPRSESVTTGAAGKSTTAWNRPNFNVLLTTYEYVMRDRAVLRKVEWQYIIVDEGHRMKNANSKFAQTLGQLYTAKRRLLLTGTPLQNSLPELWALLNFLLPSIFQSCDTFDGWFNRPFAQFGSGQTTEDQAALGHEERMLVINRLHEVLRPFVLRRVKAAVLGQLPEKIEKVLRCDLSPWQRVLYQQIQRSRAGLTSGLGEVQLLPDTTTTTNGGERENDTPDAAGSGLTPPQNAAANGCNEASADGSQAMPGGTMTDKAGRGGLNNVLMQLRKCCNHPYLFRTDAYRIDETMIRSSGKFLLLDGLLPKFKAGGHRVLVFSQMTSVMDLLEEFLTFRGYSYLRLDGSTAAEERERRVAKFNDPCSPSFVFLLSTRAGGLGLNLASADTVVIFDSDWNPMMDSQAQDRAHRIGQRNDVRVFRLIAAAPVEERILARATDKLNMNSLVVEAGKFDKDSRAHERRQMLEDLLREYCPGTQDDDDGGSSETNGPASGSASSSTRALVSSRPTASATQQRKQHQDADRRSKAEALCETVATSDDEFELYKAVDAARPVLGPMSIDEVPDFVKHGCDSLAEYQNGLTAEQKPALGSADPYAADPRNRAARKRKSDQSPYYDSLSERNFLRLIETGSLDKPAQSYKAFGHPGDLRVPLRKVKRKRS